MNLNLGAGNTKIDGYVSVDLYDKVSIIIPCFWNNQNLIDMTDRCMDSLFGTKGIDEVIVVDDGSPLKTNYTWATVIERLENGGYASAVNSGIKAASGDVLIISNNDIEFIQPDWLEHLLKPLKMGYSIASIRTTDSDGWEAEDYIEDDAKFGSLWAVKREVIDEIGLLDESFGRGYFEDLDFHERAKRAGFKIAKNHAGLVEHKGKATFLDVDPADDEYYKARAKFIKKWGSVW